MTRRWTGNPLATDVAGLGTAGEYSFFNNGSNIKNKWLDYEGSNISSYDTPAVMGGNTVLTCIKFSNLRDDANTDVEVYVNGTAPGDKVFTWEIRDKRCAYKTNNLETVTFSIGDHIRVYAKSAGNPTPQKAIIDLQFVSTDGVVGEGGLP